ncbi:MAG: hypothetical protein HY270_02490 [Deltaproteobacteria bacterium]|nr:hypothetical protein [Deltaproteobacteria bacterium]
MTFAPTLARPLLVCALLVALLSVAPEVRAQPNWGIGQWQGKASLFVDWENQDDKRSQTKYETILLQERVGLRNVGTYILDPRLLTLDLGGSFGLSQEDGLSASGTPLRVGNGRLYDYAFEGLFLSDKPYPMTWFATRSQTLLTQGFGGRSDVTFENRGAMFELNEGSFLEKYRFFNFNSRLDVHQEILKEDSSVFGSPFRRDEHRNVVRYQAHKGGENSDIDLRYELNDVNDPFNLSDIFDSHTVHLNHSLDFGPTLNRRIDSLFYYFTRSGQSPGNFISLDEDLHLDHHRDLSTDYRYSFSRSDSLVDRVTSNAASLGLQHRLYNALTTNLFARGSRQDFSNGDRTIYSGQAAFDYRRSLPWDGLFFAGTHGGYQFDENNFTSSQIAAVDEAHTAPSEFGAGAGFTLNNAFVMAETIVVLDVRGGSRLPTALNVDYVVSQVGSITTIIPLVGSPVIRPNDPLEVSYTASIDPSIKFSTATFGARTGVEFSWLGAAYEHELSNQTRLSGSTSNPQFLINQNLDRFKVDLKGRWNGLGAQSTAAYELLHSNIVDSKAWRFTEVVSYQLRIDTIAQMTGDQYLIDYPGQKRHADSYLARANVDWFSELGFSVSAFSGFRAYRDSEIPSDQIIDAGVRLRWSYRNLDIAPSFTWTDYRNRLTDIRGELRVSRNLF